VAFGHSFASIEQITYRLTFLEFSAEQKAFRAIKAIKACFCSCQYFLLFSGSVKPKAVRDKIICSPVGMKCAMVRM
jgi:hypothetical protein